MSSKYSDFEDALNDAKAKPVVSSSVLLTSAAFFVTLIGSAVLYSAQNKPYVDGPLLMSTNVVSFSDISFTFKRVGYEALPFFDEEQNQVANYQFLKEYGSVIEPSANMELHLYTTTSGTYHYRYKVCPEKGSCKEGLKYFLNAKDTLSTTVSFDCSPHEKFSYEISELDTNSKQALQTVSGSAICMYVRREIRSLTEADRDTFLDASHVLWEYDDETGKQKFGDGFMSNSMLLRFHQFNAGQQDSDHIHDGNGFLTQHLKFTNFFEASIQAVNPSVYLPYWDFTLDQSQGFVRPRESVLFTSDYYGSITSPTDIDEGFRYSVDKISNAAIPNGRWAFLKAEMNTVFEDLRYGYGYMRAPWSMNPSPYISRFVKDTKNELPSCKAHYQLLSSYKTLMEFSFMSSYAPHATVHGLTGSMYGCDTFDTLVAEGYILSSTYAAKMCSGWPFTMKAFYRKAYITPAKDCVLDVDDLESASCPFQCTAENLNTIGTYIMRFYGDYIDLTKPDVQQVWGAFVCGGAASRIYPGDHIESASPADPSFWVIHPTLERLLQAKLMAGGFADETWPTDSAKNFVCNGAECTDGATGLSGYYSNCCYGHYEDSRLLNAITGDRDTFYGPTNGELIAGTDPRLETYSMNYIYDSFDWSHCTGDYSIKTLMTSLKASHDAAAISQ